MYEANALNQYAAISENGAAAFVPQFDTDGNQTRIKTATGIWTAVYNAENRPVCFTNEATGTVVTCAYDSMGRRAFKMVTVNGSVTLHQRYLYRGYLQIACIDLTRSHHPGLWLITWAPTEATSTRPLAIQKDGTWYTYGLDLTKNVCEVFGSTGYIAAAYTYTPFGEVSAKGAVTQPILWSSEMRDGELGMVYYNWRYFDTKYGRWNSRDHHETYANSCLYCYCKNNPLYYTDYLGLWFPKRHKDLTKNSIREIELKDNNKKYKLSNIAYMKVENGNINTDSDEATKNQQKYHFCSHFENEQPADKAIENYKEALKEKIGEFNDSIKNHNPSEENCTKALEILGLITHMWQDYYGHGMEKEYTDDPGLISGSPDNPTAVPASFYMKSLLEIYGTHGGAEKALTSSIEPGDRATDKHERIKQATNFTKEKGKVLLQKWFSKCKCHKLINRVR